MSTSTPSGPQSQVKRAMVWVGKMDPSIQGESGSRPLFATACKVIEFGLSESDCMSVLRLALNARCRPPWAEAEMLHAVRSAFKKTKPLQEYAPISLGNAVQGPVHDDGELPLAAQDDIDQQKSLLAAAVSRWNSLNLSDGTHSYALRKGIKPFGARIDGTALVIAVLGADYKLQSLQNITRSGEILFEKELPAKNGFALVGSNHTPTPGFCFVRAGQPNVPCTKR